MNLGERPDHLNQLIGYPMSLSKKIKPYLLPALAGVLLSFVVLAHHSTAAYDLKRDVVLEGVVEEYHWTNPHSWMQVQVPEASGKKSWNIEFGTPSISIRVGWSPTTFKLGDRATFVVHPRSDGEPYAVLSLVVRPDGTRLSGMTQPAGPIPGIADQ